MPRYPVLEEPLPPGRATLDGYGQRIGYQGKYLYYFWRPRDGFPEPVGELAGSGTHVYDVKSLEQFRVANADLWGRRQMTRVTTGQDVDLRITPAEFAAMAGVDPQDLDPYRPLPAFPETGQDGRYRLGDLIVFWNTRPLAVPEHVRGEQRTLGHIAVHILKVARKTVTQYGDDPDFPEPDADGRYRVGDVVDYLNNRPGKRGAAGNHRGHPAGQP